MWQHRIGGSAVSVSSSKVEPAETTVTVDELLDGLAYVRERMRFPAVNRVLDDRAGRRIIRIVRIGTSHDVAWQENEGREIVLHSNSRGGFTERFKGVAFQDLGHVSNQRWDEILAFLKFRAYPGLAFFYAGHPVLRAVGDRLAVSS